MTNLKKTTAMLTAMLCMTAAVPTLEETAHAAFFGEFFVIAVDYAEGTEDIESYLLSDHTNSAYAVTVEDMNRYLTEDSAQPQIGDVLHVQVEMGHHYHGDPIGWFDFSEESSFTNLGTMEEILPEPKEYVLIREFENTGFYLMKNVKNGDEETYQKRSYDGYTTPYHMEGAEIGDTVSFYVNESGIRLFPFSVTKGDGTIPELPKAVNSIKCSTSPVIVIGAAYDPDVSYPHTYLVSMDGDEYTLGSGTIFTHMDDFAHPECGDVLMVDYSGAAASYPAQFSIPKNKDITNIGNAADLYGTKPYTVTENTGYSLILEDADGNSRYWHYDIKSYVLYHSEMSSAKVGDMVTCVLNENGNPVMPVSIDPLGDVNLDGTLDILDVIRINKYILSGEPLPALSGARTGDPGQCDFNGNGTIDADDSLGMMKRILHLE